MTTQIESRLERQIAARRRGTGASMKRKIALLMSDDLLLLAARINITTQKVNEFKSRAATLARISNRYIFAELARRGVKAVRS